MKKRTLLLLLFISIYSTTFSQKIRFINEKWEELDQNLLLTEFQKQYDHIRDSFGLSSLKFNITCDSVSKGHAIYMAKTGDFKHGKGDLDYEEMIDELLGRKCTVDFCENIFKISGTTLTKETRDLIPYEHIEKQAGDFKASLFLGKDLSYRDLVKYMIDRWMESPGHRNVLLRKINSQFSIACKSSPDNRFYACFNAF